MFCPDDGGGRLLQNSGTNLPNYKTLRRERPQSLYLPPEKLCISRGEMLLKYNKIYLTILFQLCEITIDLKFLSDEKKYIPQYDRGDPGLMPGRSLW